MKKIRTYISAIKHLWIALKYCFTRRNIILITYKLNLNQDNTYKSVKEAKYVTNSKYNTYTDYVITKSVADILKTKSNDNPTS